MGYLNPQGHLYQPADVQFHAVVLGLTAGLQCCTTEGTQYLFYCLR
jgi:hypothetical protein